MPGQRQLMSRNIKFRIRSFWHELKGTVARDFFEVFFLHQTVLLDSLVVPKAIWNLKF